MQLKSKAPSAHATHAATVAIVASASSTRLVIIPTVIEASNEIMKTRVDITKPNIMLHLLLHCSAAPLGEVKNSSLMRIQEYSALPNTSLKRWRDRFTTEEHNLPLVPTQKGEEINSTTCDVCLVKFRSPISQRLEFETRLCDACVFMKGEMDRYNKAEAASLTVPASTTSRLPMVGTDHNAIDDKPQTEDKEDKNAQGHELSMTDPALALPTILSNENDIISCKTSLQHSGASHDDEHAGQETPSAPSDQSTENISSDPGSPLNAASEDSLETVASQDTNIAYAKHVLIAAVLQQVYAMFGDDQDTQQYRQCVANEEANSGSPLLHQGDGRQNEGKGKRGRRPRDDDGSRSEEEGDQGRKKFPKNSSSLGSDAAIERLACPFSKYRPEKYGPNESTKYRYRSCKGKGFSTISHVRQHLNRIHRPIQCQNCWHVMKNTQQLLEHVQERNCEWQLPEPEGIDQEKMNLISRYGTSWEKMYEILFPGAPVPGPHVEICTTRALCPPHQSDRLQDFDAYSRRFLPQLVEVQLSAIINTDLAPLEETLRARIGSLIRECQSTLYTNFQSQGQAHSMSQAENAGDQTPPQFLPLAKPTAEMQRSSSRRNTSTNDFTLNIEEELPRLDQSSGYVSEPLDWKWLPENFYGNDVVANTSPTLGADLTVGNNLKEVCESSNFTDHSIDHMERAADTRADDVTEWELLMMKS
ncbi:uncharacterized protein KY384_001714 [Bacidia gigantensis]|uniref:uncharacterized protein n=1 Tax=Bacidia gigantensis TaxID=2732470 RepID=UPI001D055082|nr:uncharacterized protein KY384_001714 [Bacidia gigantensis]KAG8533971.1 hypothetical protein KY384_001714 [Bacidia gigantensis]